METRFSEDQWHVVVCRTTRAPSAQKDGNTTFWRQWHVRLCRTAGRQGATPRKMETLFSEDPWQVLLCRKTGASSAQKDRNATFWRPVACSTLQNDRASACNAQKDGNTIFWRPMACCSLQKDWSLERPERRKRHFLKTSGMFCFAERQEPRAPRKMETPLSEDQRHVLFCRTTRASSAEKDGNASSWRPVACSTLQNDRTSGCNAQKDGNATFWRPTACFILQNDKSPERRERWKHYFLKTNDMFCFAERQEPRAPRKMETPLSEDQWHVLLCRTARASSAQKDGNVTFWSAVACTIFQNTACNAQKDGNATFWSATAMFDFP